MPITAVAYQQTRQPLPLALSKTKRPSFAADRPNIDSSISRLARLHNGFIAAFLVNLVQDNQGPFYLDTPILTVLLPGKKPLTPLTGTDFLRIIDTLQQFELVEADGNYQLRPAKFLGLFRRRVDEYEISQLFGENQSFRVRPVLRNISRDFGNLAKRHSAYIGPVFPSWRKRNPVEQASFLYYAYSLTRWGKKALADATTVQQSLKKKG